MRTASSTIATSTRHFADTTGGGRDTLWVAIADLGTGSSNSFTNNGMLALPAVTGATKLEDAGQYLPLNNPNNAMALNGPLQGHLIGVNTFTNSGIIDLQNNPRRWRRARDHRLAAGRGSGTGTCISLLVRRSSTRALNEGGAATRSDTLVVDGTSVGTGPTSMAIRNAGGAGALTVGDGILVVQVLDPTRSASGVFSLQGGSITAGAFDYFLFKGGVSSPGVAGNWYLRNELVAPPITPIPPITPAEDGARHAAVAPRRPRRTP